MRMPGLLDRLRSTETGGKTADLGLLTLRLGAGGLMAYGHGWGKLTSFSQHAAGFPDPLGVGHAASLVLTIFAELVCSLAVAAGFATRLSAIPVVFTMIVAAFVVNAGHPFGDKELALLYCLPFLALVLAGGGRYSLDRLLTPSGRR
jgi:putative oxidoreductase